MSFYLIGIGVFVLKAVVFLTAIYFVVRLAIRHSKKEDE